MKYMLAVWIFTMACLGQTAQVVPLSSSDAAMAKQSHQAMLDAEKKWADVQEQIKMKYLIVEKNDPAASDIPWYADTGLYTGTVSAATFTLGTNSDYHYRCETEEEKKVRLAREQKYEAEQKVREVEREAKARRYRKGWEVHNCYSCNPPAFEFSEDYKFIVPKAPEPTLKQSSPNLIWNSNNTAPLTIQ